VAEHGKERGKEIVLYTISRRMKNKKKVQIFRKLGDKNQTQNFGRRGGSVREKRQEKKKR